MWIFQTLWVIISWVWVICKRLNVNWKNIHSIILSVTCHSLRNFSPLIPIPSYPFVKFWNPMIDYFLSLSHLLKVECELKKNLLYNFICHLSFLKKLSSTHTHPHISIREFLKPYDWLFLGFKSFVKCWMWIGKNSVSNLSVTCHSLRNFSSLIHIPSYPFMNFWNPLSYYFLSLSHS